jgi:hypothetical protein
MSEQAVEKKLMRDGGRRAASYRPTGGIPSIGDTAHDAKQRSG